MTAGDDASRGRTRLLLGELRADRWKPTAWRRFLARSGAMSAQAACTRPWAAAEVTALHLVIGALARGRVPGASAAAIWGPAVTYLGLLGDRRHLGWPNTLTLLRANLPAVGPRMPCGGRLLGPAALALDVLDGRVARHRGEVTRFGAYGDSLADAAFWMWFAVRHEHSRALRAAAAAAWAVPAQTGGNDARCMVTGWLQSSYRLQVRKLVLGQVVRCRPAANQDPCGKTPEATIHAPCPAS